MNGRRLARRGAFWAPFLALPVAGLVWLLPRHLPVSAAEEYNRGYDFGSGTPYTHSVNEDGTPGSDASAECGEHSAEVEVRIPEHWFKGCNDAATGKPRRPPPG